VCILEDDTETGKRICGNDGKISNVWAANMYVAKELWVWTIEQMFLLQYPCLRTKTAYKILNAEK